MGWRSDLRTKAGNCSMLLLLSLFQKLLQKRLSNLHFERRVPLTLLYDALGLAMHEQRVADKVEWNGARNAAALHSSFGHAIDDTRLFILGHGQRSCGFHGKQ